MLTVTITSDADRDDLFAEVWHADVQIAEVSRDEFAPGHAVEFFADNLRRVGKLSVSDLMQALETATAKLSEMYPET